MKRLCQCCGTADISHRHFRALYCLPCRNSGAVLVTQKRAVSYVNVLVRAGLLPRADTLKCVDCGAPAEEYDHRDYAKPLDVEPVCHGCNARRGTAANKFPWRTTEPAKAVG